MPSVERNAGDFVIDVALLAGALNLTEDEIRRRMRNGEITSLCETGVDEDEGRWRLTFYHGNRACRFIVDAVGNILDKTTFPTRARPKEPVREHAESAANRYSKGFEP